MEIPSFVYSNFYIRNFQFMSSNIQSTTNHGFFHFTAIRYVRTSLINGYFRHTRLSYKLLTEGYNIERWWNFIVNAGVLFISLKSPSPECKMTL